jgi:hypothetical protein
MRDPLDPITAILDSAKRLALHDPDAFGKFVVEILCQLAELDRDAYDYLLGGMISRELLAAGLLVALEQAKQALASGDALRVVERVNAIESWVRTIEHLGSRERVEALMAEHVYAETQVKIGYVM